MNYKKLLIAPVISAILLPAGSVAAAGKTYNLPPACDAKFSTVEPARQKEAKALYVRLKSQYKSTLHERYEKAYVQLKQKRDTVHDTANRKGLYATTNAKYQRLLNELDDSLGGYDDTLTATQNITSDLVNAESNRLQLLCSPSYQGYQQGLADNAKELQSAQGRNKLYNGSLAYSRKDTQKKLATFKKYVTQYKKPKH